MANTLNAFGLLLEDIAPQSDANKKRMKKKKRKSKAIPSSLKEDTETCSPPSTSKVAAAKAEDEQEGFQTVGKGSRAKGLASAKSLELHIPKESAQLATQARQEAEKQASSPYIQGTVESWMKEVQGVQTSSYLEASGKAISWKEVLLSSRAMEALISTCLAEKVDTSLEPMLAALFTHIAAEETAEKRTLAEALATAVVRLAHAVDRKLPQNVAAAENALKQLLALLQVPEERKPPRQAALANGTSAQQAESRMMEKAAQLKAAKPGKQAELWAQLSELWQQVSGGGHSYAHTSEPAAVSNLRSFEAALKSFTKDPAAQKNAAAATGEKLTSQRAAIQKKLQDALAVVDGLRCELAAVEQDIAAHLSQQEQPVQQINPDSLRQQLAIAQQLAGQLGSSEPVAVPRQPVISSETRTALSEAAGAVLCSQLGLQREVATKAFHANERWSRKRQQVEQLAGFGESKDHKTAASQLEVIEREIKKYEKDSAEIRDFAKSVALAAAGAGAPPHVVSEHAELVDACMQQHAKLLDGPVKLQGARMEMLVQDVRAPLIGNAVATSGLQQPISRPVTSPIAAPAQESDVPQPSFSRGTEGAYSQWKSAVSPSQHAWQRHQPPNFGELLQGSSVSEAPSKTPAPIAPASFHSAVETLRGGATTLVSRQSPSGHPSGSPQQDAAALPETLSSTPAQPVGDGFTNGGGHVEVTKPKRYRSRNRHKPAPA